jgi:large subunit ribosomal protein L20
MPRVKRGVQHAKRRRNLLAKTKGMMWGRKSKIKLARVAELKAGKYAYRDRRVKKREFRQLWQVRLNAALRPLGLSYSRFMDAVHKAGIELDRKILSTLAKDQPKVFEAIVSQIKK